MGRYTYKNCATLFKGNSLYHGQTLIYFISYFALLGRTKEAWENYNKALQLNPTHAVAMVNMARQLRAEGKIRDAEITYKRFALTCINFT